MKLSEYLKKENKRPADIARDFGIVHCMARRWLRSWKMRL